MYLPVTVGYARRTSHVARYTLITSSGENYLYTYILVRGIPICLCNVCECHNKSWKKNAKPRVQADNLAETQIPTHIAIMVAAEVCSTECRYLTRLISRK